MISIIPWGGYKSDAVTSTDELLNYEYGMPVLKDENPLNRIPFHVRMSFTREFYQPGSSSVGQRYVEDILDRYGNDYVQSFMNKLYGYAIRRKSHILAANTIIILSQLPFGGLGEWAEMLALSATRSPYLDVQEYGIRCFENWDNKEACEFLRGCSFTEHWLQDYADEVCEYILSEGTNKDVLSEKNISWKMAGRSSDATSYLEGYRSGYRNSGV